MKPADTRIEPGTKVRLSKWDADDTGIIGNDKSDAREQLDAYRAKLETLQELLYAEGRHRLLVVLQDFRRAQREEQVLADAFGPECLAYKARTWF